MHVRICDIVCVERVRSSWRAAPCTAASWPSRPLHGPLRLVVSCFAINRTQVCSIAGVPDAVRPPAGPVRFPHAHPWSKKYQTDQQGRRRYEPRVRAPWSLTCGQLANWSRLCARGQQNALVRRQCNGGVNCAGPVQGPGRLGGREPAADGLRGHHELWDLSFSLFHRATAANGRRATIAYRIKTSLGRGRGGPRRPRTPRP